MRKSFSLLFACLALVAGARQISSDEAAAIASDFLGSSTIVKKAAAAVNVRRAQAKDATRGTEDNQPYYIFNADDDNGFVIIAGDDRTKKIIGYSDTGNFDLDNMPPQLAAMLDQYAGQIAKLTADTADPSWSAPSRSASDGGEGVLLETANWGQGYPYNAQCPVIDGVQAPTGCVATAMAIVMKYHNWPEGYDWDSMPSSNLENACEPVSKLMKDAGEAVFMNYGPVESGANMNWVGHKLQQDFKYSPDCQFITKANFDGGEWLDLLKSNLDNDNPVIFSGTDLSDYSSHAFVLDGYRDDTYHVNWGWDGSCNGYYALSALQPNSIQDFSANSGMVINICPDHSGKEYSECFCDYGYFWAVKGLFSESMNIDVENIEQNVEFSVVHTLVTLPAGFNGLLGLALVDDNDNIKEIVATEKYSTFSVVDNCYKDHGYGCSFLHVKINCGISPTDRLQIVSRNETDSEFKLVLGTLEFPSSIPVHDNKPRIGNVNFNIDNGINVKYFTGLYETDYTDLHSSCLKILKGLTLSILLSLDENSTDKSIYVKIKGPQIYGDTEVSGDDIWTGVSIYGDYEIEAKAIATIDEEIFVTDPGTLNSLISPERANIVKSLKLSGNINAVDIWYIRDNFGALETLDMTDCRIMEVEASNDRFLGTTYELQPAGYMPEWALTSLKKLSKLFLPYSLTGLGSNSLSDLNLSYITIPEGVTYIGLNVFYANNNLRYIEHLNPIPTDVNECIFTSTPCPESGKLYVPVGSKSDFLEASVWNEFHEIIEDKMPDNLGQRAVVDNLVYKLSGTEAILVGYENDPVEVNIPSNIEFDHKIYSITEIGEEAFYDCESLKSISMPETIAVIGVSCFNRCHNLEKAIISPNIDKIPWGAFGYTYSLDEIDFSNVKVIGGYAFEYSKLSRLKLPEDCRYENSEPCFGSNWLEDVYIAPGNKFFNFFDGVLYRITDDGNYMIESVSNQYEGTLRIAEGTTVLNGYNIVGCHKITRIELPNSLTAIKDGAINQNYELEHILISGNPFIYEEAVRYCDKVNAITFHGTPRYMPNSFRCPSLQNIYITHCDNFNVDTAFGNVDDELNYFVPATYINDSHKNKGTIHVPGGFNMANNSAHSEMWSYKINRKEGLVKIEPQIEGIEIDRVAVNGREVAKGDGGIYYYGEADVAEIAAFSDQEPLDVVVDYTLHGRQTMTTHYDAEFNAAIPDDIITGVSQVSQDEAECFDIYNLQGICVKRDATRGDVDNLAPGLYIVNGQKVIVGR